jgi:acetyl-CoA C-acetyltransferase
MDAKDGLTDAYDNSAMGCVLTCATEYNFSREDQDNFAIQSYERVQKHGNRKFDNEVVPVSVPQRKEILS